MGLKLFVGKGDRLGQIIHALADFDHKKFVDGDGVEIVVVYDVNRDD